MTPQRVLYVAKLDCRQTALEKHVRHQTRHLKHTSALHGGTLLEAETFFFFERSPGRCTCECTDEKRLHAPRGGGASMIAGSTASYICTAVVLTRILRAFDEGEWHTGQLVPLYLEHGRTRMTGQE